MTLTMAHPQPIVSLLAGILILDHASDPQFHRNDLSDHPGSNRTRAVSLTLTTKLFGENVSGP